MKTTSPKLAAEDQPPVFPKTLHRARPGGKEASLDPATQKRDNIFSKSRDTREDRGLRQMKTMHNSQTFSRDCGNSSR